MSIDPKRIRNSLKAGLIHQMTKAEARELGWTEGMPVLSEAELEEYARRDPFVHEGPETIQ